MHSSSSSSRFAALVSLAGVALIMLGFFLPMFTESNPQVPGSAHPVYEWQAVTVVNGFPIVFALFVSLAVLPVLGMLIILATSIAEVFRGPSPRLILLKRVPAALGLVIQLLLDSFVFIISSLGYGRIDIASGLVVVLIGFIVTVIGAFVVEAHK